jgi:hypothetical protein
MLPMFVRVVRHALDDLTSWARSDPTTKSTVSVGGPHSVGDDGPVFLRLDHACGPLLDVAADDIEHQIDAADVFQRVVVEVDELLRASRRLLTVGRASAAMTRASLRASCVTIVPTALPRRAQDALPA